MVPVMADIGDAVLLDANLLLLVIVGEFDPSLIGRKRLDIYTRSDWDRLLDIMRPFRRRLTTPHLLAEVSNLADQCVPKHRHREFREFFHEFIAGFDERWTDAIELCGTAEFITAGLADAAVAHLADGQTTVLSVDAELCGLLWGKGVNAENFNRLRGL